MPRPGEQPEVLAETLRTPVVGSRRYSVCEGSNCGTVKPSALPASRRERSGRRPAERRRPRDREIQRVLVETLQKLEEGSP